MSPSSLIFNHSTLSFLPRNQTYMDSLIPPSRDQFEHIAHVQAQREEEIKRRIKEQRQSSHSEPRRRQSPLSVSDGQHQRVQAARVIQKTFRGFRARREMNGFTLDPASRWIAAVQELRFREATRPRPATSLSMYSQDTMSTAETDDARSTFARWNWKKVGMIARRAGHVDSEDEYDTDSSSDLDGSSPQDREEKEELRRMRREANALRRQTALTLGLQYWLEIVDVKHRYGTNLRMYHEEWRKANTNENFFYWLDCGEGRYISLQGCSRERLEKDQVRYLSREERQYYLATVDEQGRICWAKNGEPIDTSNHYRDSVCGIVPEGDPTPVWRSKAERPSCGEFATDDDLAASPSAVHGDESHEPGAGGDDAVVNPPIDKARPVKKVVQISATTAFDKLLRKMVRDGTWIFVADTSFRLYVGIKQAGAFQHSSFLQGGRISAGGLIGIQDGRLTSLSPLSGHYRPPTSNFRSFVRNLEAEGVDVSHVPVFKSFAVLYGLETYVKARRKGRGLMRKMARGRDKLLFRSESDVSSAKRRGEKAAAAAAETGNPQQQRRSG